MHTVSGYSKAGINSERKTSLQSFPQLFQEHNIQPEQKAIREPLGMLPYLFTVGLGKKNMSAHSYNGHGPSGFSHDSAFHCNNF